MEATLATLTEAELGIARSTDPEALAELDEDGLLELHDRVRRARTKHLGQYRSHAAARVEGVGGRGRGRGKAYTQNQRARDKAEVFEMAPARVSTALAKAAPRAAADTYAEPGRPACRAGG